MTAKARMQEAVANAFAMKGGGSVALIVASTLVLAAVGNSIAGVLGPLGQCLLYPMGWSGSADPAAAAWAAAQQAILPLVLLGALIWVLYRNTRINAQGSVVNFGLPRRHRGLVAMLSQFPGQRKGRFSSLAEAATAMEREPFEQVRAALLDSTIGPLAAAVEYHSPALKRCWIVVTGGKGGTAELFGDAEKVLKEFAPTCGFTPVHLAEAHNLELMTEIVGAVYREAEHDSEAGRDIIADFTGGTAAMSAGMVLATLHEDRDVEYLRQDIRLVEDGRALTAGEIAERPMLVAVTTSPALVRSLLPGTG